MPAQFGLGMADKPMMPEPERWCPVFLLERCDGMMLVGVRGPGSRVSS